MDAERIQRLREVLKVTQAELAGIVDASPRTVEGWEAGKPIHRAYAAILRNLESEYVKG